MVNLMTPEERMRRFISGTRNPYTDPAITMGSQVDAQLQNIDPSQIPGMPQAPQIPDIPQPNSIPAEGDYSSEEATIANQRAYANSLRGSELPGLHRVGPSNIAVSNPWEGLETGFNRALGGYLSGKADKEATALGKTKKKEAAERAAAISSRDNADEMQRREELADAKAIAADKEGWSRDMAERKQKESERATEFQENMDTEELGIARQEMALDAVELEPIQYLRNDGSKLYVGYRLNEGDTAVEPYNLDTGKKVNMGDLTYDTDQIGGEGKSYNEPVRYVHHTSGDEQMISFRKDGTYKNMTTGEVLSELPNGYTPEPAMSESQREASVTKWVKENSQTLELMHDIDAANAVFAKANPDGSETPPFNWFTKQKGMVGDAFRAIADVGDDEKSQQNAYSAASTVFNAISRIRAGLSQTVNEIERINEETGRNLVVSPEVLVQYWDRLGDKVTADLSRANETMSPNTMKALNRWRMQKGQQGLTSGFDGSGGNRRGAGADANRSALENEEERLRRELEELNR